MLSVEFGFDTVGLIRQATPFPRFVYKKTLLKKYIKKNRGENQVSVIILVWKTIFAQKIVKTYDKFGQKKLFNVPKINLVRKMIKS